MISVTESRPISGGLHIVYTGETREKSVDEVTPAHGGVEADEVTVLPPTLYYSTLRKSRPN